MSTTTTTTEPTSDAGEPVDGEPTPIILEPAVVTGGPHPADDSCHERTGTTYQTLQPCGWRLEEEADVYPPAVNPPPAPQPTITVATTQPPYNPPTLPETGNETAGIAMIAALLVAVGYWLKKLGQA